MKIQLKLWQKGIIIIALPLTCELVFVSVLGTLLHGVEVEARNTERSRNIVLEAEQMERVFFQAGAALAGYQASKNPLLVLQYQQAQRRIAAEMELLDRLCSDNKRQRAELAEIHVHIAKGLSLLEVYKARIERDDVMATPLDKEVAKSVMALGDTLGKIVANEKEMEISRPQAERHLRQLVEQCLLCGVALNVIIAIALSIYFSRGITRRLLILSANSERLAQQQDLLPVMPGTDEIARLDTVFHRMAETLVEAARKERAVVEHAADVICSIDPQGRFAACNPAAERIWGYKVSELLEKNLESVVDPEFIEITRSNFNVARNKEPTCVFENRILGKSAKPVDMRWSVYWSDSEQRSFCVAHDISGEKQAEKLRKEVLDMVTHDLRTPLTSMELSIDMLQQGKQGTLSTAASKELDKIKRNSSRLMRLVNDLLDMEKLKEGKLRLVRKHVNLQLIVESAFDVVSSVALHRQIRLIERNTDVDLFADGIRISQVLINLLSNALKFAPSGSEVLVEAEVVENETVVRLIDSGPGMTSEEANRLFQRFSQLESHMQQGSGLGLAICKALVDLHGGSIGVDSKLAEGSVFWFRIPLAEDTGRGFQEN
jgi:PAS domain S-box-containing protein